MTLWLFAVVAIIVLLVLWPPTPRSLARLGRRLLGLIGILPRARRNRVDLTRWLVRRPALLAAVSTYEGATLAANGVGVRLKYLASLKASSVAGCPF